MLYEVITITFLLAGFDDRNAGKQVGQLAVHVVQLRGESLGHRQRELVITSYSIHYTKLYEPRQGRRGGPFALNVIGSNQKVPALYAGTVVGAKEPLLTFCQEYRDDTDS